MPEPVYKQVLSIFNFLNFHILSKLVLEEKTTRQKFSGDRQKQNSKPNKNKTSNPYDADDSDSEDIPSSYTQVSIQV